MYLYFQVGAGAPRTLTEDTFAEGSDNTGIKFGITTPDWSTITVTATDKNDVVSISESAQVFIEEPNYPELVNCDIVAR